MIEDIVPGLKVQFTAKARTLYDNNYGSKEFQDFWKTARNKPYWVVLPRDSSIFFGIFDYYVKLEGWGWYCDKYLIEPYKSKQMETE